MHAGIDVSKNWVDVAIYETGEFLSQATPTKASKWLKKRGVLLVVLEATGGYELPMMHALSHENIPVSRINPRQIRQFSGALGYVAKTDTLDARVLAHYAQMVKPSATRLPAKELVTLRSMCMRRRELVALRTAERNRLQQTQQNPWLEHSIKTLLECLKTSITDIEKEIAHLIKQHSELHTLYNNLLTMPGIGKTTAAMLISYMPELGNANRREIAALAGIAPFTKQSGQWQGKSFCSGGRAPVREVLYMAAVSATRMDNCFSKKYQQLVSKGKPPKVAIIAVMRKMLLILNSMVQNNTTFGNLHT